MTFMVSFERRVARRAGILALLCACASSVGSLRVASAQAQPSGDANEARLLFDRGVALIDQGRFADAILSLEASQRLRPSPAVTYNIALALRGVGRVQESIAAFERYLLQPSRNATPEELARIRATVVELRQSLARLVLRVVPPGALVRIDGAAARAIAEPIVLDPGAHVIELSAQHYVSERRTLTVAPSATMTLDIALRESPDVATLAVEPTVAHATVWIDDQLVGTGSVAREVASGEHRVRVECRECSNATRVVRVSRGQTLRVQMDVTRRAGVSPGVIGVAIGGSVAVATATAIVVGVLVSNANAPRPYDGELVRGSGTWGGNHSFKRSNRPWR